MCMFMVSVIARFRKVFRIAPKGVSRRLTGIVVIPLLRIQGSMERTQGIGYGVITGSEGS